MTATPTDETRAALKKTMAMEAAATRPLRGLTWMLGGCGVVVVLFILATVLIPFWQWVRDAKDMVRQFLTRVEAAEYDEAYADYVDADMYDPETFRLIAQQIHDRIGNDGFSVKRFEREDHHHEGEGEARGAGIIVAQLGDESRGIELRVWVYKFGDHWLVAGLTLKDTLAEDEPAYPQTQPGE